MAVYNGGSGDTPVMAEPIQELQSYLKFESQPRTMVIWSHGILLHALRVTLHLRHVAREVTMSHGGYEYTRVVSYRNESYKLQKVLASELGRVELSPTPPLQIPYNREQRYPSRACYCNPTRTSVCELRASRCISSTTPSTPLSYWSTCAVPDESMSNICHSPRCILNAVNVK